MKKTIAMAGLLALSLLFGGCPYESAVPLGPPAEGIDERLIGAWRHGEEVYTVSKANERSYDIEVTEAGKSNHYSAYITSINSTAFLNFRMEREGGEASRYAFYKLGMQGPDTLLVSPVTDNVREKFDTPDRLRQFVAEHMKNEYLFDPAERLVRIIQ